MPRRVKLPKNAIAHLEPDVSLAEFLLGEPLTYAGAAYRPCVATYRAGVGIYVAAGGVDLEKPAKVLDDAGATRFYNNVTRPPQNSEEAES